MQVSNNQMMTLLVQNLSKDDEFHNLDVEANVTVEDLKCLLEIESSIPVSDQVLFFKNEELKSDTKKLSDYGVTNNDMLMMSKQSGTMQRST